MDLWMTEYETKNLGLTCRIKEVLYTGKSEFQKIAVLDSYEFGRMLVLDGVYQTSIFDEYTYHEMIAHIPLCAHPDPRRVLIIGGGDGGTAREVLKHQAVQQLEMVEIDGMVVELCKKYLPEISEALRQPHPKLDLTIGDGIKHMKQASGQYDVIIVDCSDPIGPGEGLFTLSFYQDVYKALKPDGLFVQQTESPFYHRFLIKRLHADIKSIFPIAKLFLASVPIYPGGLHCFTVGSKQYDPAEIRSMAPEGLRCYNRELHVSSFVMPNFVREIFAK